MAIPRDGMPMQLQIGNRIWRNVDADTVAGNPHLEKTERGYAFRAAYSQDRRAWTVSSGRYGIVCFCDSSEIPENWTYFRVVRMDRRYAIVVPVAGSEDELVRRFCTAPRIANNQMSQTADCCLAR